MKLTEKQKQDIRSSPGSVQYRYFALDPDGERIGYSHAWVQRPVAVQRSELNGWALWDSREDEIIVEPDVAKRIQHYTEAIGFAKDELAELQERLADIERANLAERMKM